MAEHGSKGEQARLPAPTSLALDTPPRPHQLTERPTIQAMRDHAARLNARTANRTGLPDRLKQGMEAVSGLSLDDVRVHRNSEKPAQLDAHAYAQGGDIHLAPGQDHHLPHEAWHVVQQKQGRVRPTMLAHGAAVNDDPGLEREADAMGARALRQSDTATAVAPPLQRAAAGDVAQCILIKVTTRRLMTARVVDQIEFADRVPTTASGGQGDHTVAEALIELTLQKHCRGKTHVEVAKSLPQLLFHLDESVSAKYLGGDKKFHVINLEGILALIHDYGQQATSGAEGEDLNEMLSHILEMFLRVWNKRAGSAYLRSEGKTTGGSGGADEKKAKQELTDLSGRTDLDEDQDDEGAGWKLTAARALTKFIDFRPSTDINEAARHLATAVNLTVESLEYGDMHYEHIATMAVQIYAQMNKLTKEAETVLDEKTLFLLNGETYSDFEDDEAEADAQKMTV